MHCSYTCLGYIHGARGSQTALLTNGVTARYAASSRSITGVVIMADEFIALDISGISELGKKLDRFIPAVQDAIVDQVGDYLLNVFKTYPPVNHSITRAQAYPDAFAISPRGKRIRGYFSWAQFRKVMAMANEGAFPYHRTQAMRQAWRKIGEGKNAIIANETAAAFYTMDDERQARLNKLVGWKTVGDIIRERQKEIQRQAVIGLKKGMKKAGLKE